MQIYVLTILLFSEILLLRVDVFTDLIVVTSSHECSAEPIQIIVEVNLQYIKQISLVHGKD